MRDIVRLVFAPLAPLAPRALLAGGSDVGGDLTVASTPGGGSTFTLVLRAGPTTS